MAGEFNKFIWQHEYNRKWKNYTYDEHCILNKAVEKSQKTVTLPSKDPKKKINVNLEKMFQKNLISGYEQHVRVLVSSGPVVSWIWQDDYDDWVSFSPRVAFYLELAYMKKLSKVDIFMKTDYEINLKDFKQKNKETDFIRAINREVVDITGCGDGDTYFKLAAFASSCETMIKHMSQDNITSSYDVIFELPSSQSTESSSSPVDISHHENILRALQDHEKVKSKSDNANQAPDVIVPVDPECPEADNYHVYCEATVAYKATLNLTSLQDNSNKYFIIELLKRHNKSQYAVWFHWGRTGYKGQHNLIKCGNSLNEAKALFEKKFYDKTRNEWSEKDNFERVPNKYDLVHTDLFNKKSLPVPTTESKLDIRIQALMNKLCNKNILEEVAKEMSYDSNATPLGKITPKQIIEGYAALGNISRILDKKGKGKDLIEACNVFYTKIPHDFKRKSPPLLKTLEDVQEKLKMLETLSNIGVAMDVLNATSTAENPLDRYYRSLECNLIPLDHNSEKFNALLKCLRDTHGPTHKLYKMEVIDAFECNKNEQDVMFQDYGNKMLLWHGSRISNWIGILKKGLLIAPPEAPSTGFMFGKGIYFADVGTKSANYSYPTKRNNEGMLLLSEVSLGNTLTARHAADLSNLPEGFNSVLGEGKIRPASFETTALASEASLPFGPLQEEPDPADDMFSLNYNEYVVYNVRQVKMKYLVHVKFIF